ncbi:NADH-quinone oxidoreductase subunit NuoI [Candidatus Protochlamydia amoebophila]|uniref:NADH-quinone oxidoreductase subunit I n=1 Tax=Candidatus Protochlamydia amoebophila TaxID=362787 RepID=A0A0C1K0Z9_9BACT|nr:NADH-quinone oxidoreductase subunit NuoI [Candidatus Protochlamydia amoebophila]KIC73102.1 NADH-quinone oxidoreductase subunit I [Candidatus Protochlamydia amoebophila]
MRTTIHKVITMMKGLIIVLKHAFQTPVTLRYPEEKRILPARSRGRHYLTKWNDGLERCVGCELCAIVCPAQAIYVKPAANEPGHIHSHGERYASDFQINMLRCIFCGYCEEACPTGAIVLSNQYELSAYTREDMIYTKDRLTEKTPGESGRDPRREI